MKTLINALSVLFFTFYFNSIFSQSTIPITKLPDALIGEWYKTNPNPREYNGKLIHEDFIEYGFKAYVYQHISKDSTNTYYIHAKDANKNTIDYQLKVISSDSIQLKSNNYPFATYTKQKLPKNGMRIATSDIPEAIKKSWYTTDNNNFLEFKVSDTELWFKGKSYAYNDMIQYGIGKDSEFRFVVNNGKEYWMFYFKHWSEDYLQVGFNGMNGPLYKANTAYPDTRIVNVKAFLNSKVPKYLRGNWLKTDGSNLWHHSFFYDYAIINKAIWKYSSIKEKGNLTIFTLKRNQETKTVVAKLNSDNTVSFGSDKKKLTPYSLKKNHKQNFVHKTTDDFKLEYGFATYSGIIKDYNKEIGETGMIYVNNIYTGNQNSHLIKINDDGSFSVKFPSYYLQKIFVKIPNYYGSIYVAPNKETWQLIDYKTNAFFAGDLAVLNTESVSLDVFNKDTSYYLLTRNINNLSLEEYKKGCFAIQKKQLNQLDSLVEVLNLSKTTYELEKLNLTYRGYERALSYDMYSTSNENKDQKRIDKDYISFITPTILNNKMAIHINSYNSFINRLRFLRFLRENSSIEYPNVSKLGKLLKAEKVALTNEEIELIDLHDKFEITNADALKKQKDFRNEHQKILGEIGIKMSAVYRALPPKLRTDLSGESLEDIEELAKLNDIDLEFSSQEKTIYTALITLLTNDEQEQIKAFFSNKELNKRNEDFINKHKDFINLYLRNIRLKKNSDNYHDIFGYNLTSDIIISQEFLGHLHRDYSPLSDYEITTAKTFIQDPFIANVFTIENNTLINTIEANKTKTEYADNEIPKTEKEKVFDQIIEKYKGKVIYVDFWATWCGPCRSGMERMKPLKEELIKKDVVFVYITSPSSPENTYKNMIQNIKGEHFRVSKDEWNYIASRFNISGIPHYLLIDKKGTIIKDNTSDLRTPESVELLIKKIL